MPVVRSTLRVLAALGGCALATSCAGDDDTASTTAPPVAGSASGQTAPAGGRCVVRLHGKGGAGAATTTDGGVSTIAPTGNADGWGGRQWLYFPDGEYESARDIVAESIAGCDQVIVNGFSNGGAFAAKLFCRGETFDGRLVRVVVDDPVVDNGVEGCTPDPAVAVTLYWTGALDATAQPGWDCAEADWTCEGGTTIGIEAYAAALGTDVLESPHGDHQWYLDAPELSQW